MRIEARDFFKKLKDTNDPDLLLFYRLYKDPFSVLGTEQDLDKLEEEYDNLYCYCQLMMNNNLIEFLNAAIFDPDFSICDEAHIQIWIKLRNFLWDSIEFRDYYMYMEQHPELMNLIRRFKTVTVGEIQQYSKEHPGLIIIGDSSKSFCELADMYNRYEKLYNYGYTSEQIKSYNTTGATNAISWIDLNLTVTKEIQDAAERKEGVLRRIGVEDCSINTTDDDVYLISRNLRTGFIDPLSPTPGMWTDVFDAVVCNNRFLDIVEAKLKEYELASSAVKNALSIINAGINIKKNIEPNAEVLRYRLGEATIQQFDLKHAERIANDLLALSFKQEKREKSECKIYLINQQKN